MTNTSYNHPNRPALGSGPAPATSSTIHLRAGESVVLTGPRAGEVQRTVRKAPPTISYVKRGR